MIEQDSFFFIEQIVHKNKNFTAKNTVDMQRFTTFNLGESPQPTYTGKIIRTSWSFVDWVVADNHWPGSKPLKALEKHLVHFDSAKCFPYVWDYQQPRRLTKILAPECFSTSRTRPLLLRYPFHTTSIINHIYHV